MNTLKAAHSLLRVAIATFFFYAIALPVHAQSGKTELVNPVSAAGSIPQFIELVLKAVVMIALPIITLFFVYAGFKFIMAQGNPTKLQEAKWNLLFSVIGAILILGAWVIATLIGGTVSQLVKP